MRAFCLSPHGSSTSVLLVLALVHAAHLLVLTLLSHWSLTDSHIVLQLLLELHAWLSHDARVALLVLHLLAVGHAALTRVDAHIGLSLCTASTWLLETHLVLSLIAVLSL